MEIYLYPTEWLKLPMDTRTRLRELFNIPRSKGTIVEGNIVKSDGCTVEDLQKLTIEKMQGYLNTNDSDFVSLFNEVVTRIDEERELELPQEPEIDPRQAIVDSWVYKLSSMQMEAKSQGMDDFLRHTIQKIFNLSTQPLTPLPSNADVKPKKRGRPAKKTK